MRLRHLNRPLGSLLVAWIVACGHPAAESDAASKQIPTPAEVRVVRVVDAERLVLRIGEREVRVRLIGVDARFSRSLGCSTDEGSVNELVEGGHLRIERDSRAKDDEGRTWVWLWSGEELVNAALLRSGAATLGRYWPNQRNEAALLRAQLSAAREHRGLWARCPALQDVTRGGSSGRRCDPSYPGACIAPFPPDLDCSEIRLANFLIVGPDLHDLDGDGDALGCERFNPM
jgi:micrococcal nuclease